MQALYITYNPDGDAFKLPYCIIVFGFFQFIMSQLPDLHSLRFINALSNVCTLLFSTIAIGMSIHNGMPSTVVIITVLMSSHVCFSVLRTIQRKHKLRLCVHLNIDAYAPSMAQLAFARLHADSSNTFCVLCICDSCM